MNKSSFQAAIEEVHRSNTKELNGSAMARAEAHAGREKMIKVEKDEMMEEIAMLREKLQVSFAIFCFPFRGRNARR